MTTGIYLLRFKNTDKVYIGQSKDIEKRFSAHLYLLKKQLGAEKVQEAYAAYGEPTLEILVECSVEELNKLEQEAVDIYDSITNGLNTISPGSYSTIQYGQDASNAKYTNKQYIKVLFLLVKGESLRDIEELTGVSYSVISSIRKCENHNWLEELYPIEYSILKKRKEDYSHKNNNTAAHRGIVYPKLVSPEGVIYEVSSLRAFAREHGLASSNLEKLLNGAGYTLHGWSVLGRDIPKYPKIVSPEGVEYEIKYGNASKFAKEHGLNPAKLSELINNKVSHHKGWKLKKDV